MNKLFLQLFAVGACFAFGHALQCYQCFGLPSTCLTMKTTCNSGELCYSGTGKAAIISIKMKGCLAEAKCNMTEQVNFPSGQNTTAYTMTKICCSGDLCNAAPGLPGASGLSLALASLTALFVAKVLV